MITNTFYLAWRYLRFHRVKSVILVACLTSTFLLPITVHLLVRYYNEALLDRAESTPLLIGARGNRFDLVLKALYFATDYDDHVSMADVETVRDRDYGTPIPLYIRYTAHGHRDASAPNDVTVGERAPVVGTTLAYFEHRGLEIASGSRPLVLGDAVLGASAAEALGVRVGDAVVSDPDGFYDVARSFQLKMPVVGILSPAGSPDDHAVFVDVKTAWIIDGIGHGHDDLEKTGDPIVVDVSQSDSGNIVATPRLARYREITAENRDSFHFHGDPQTYPLTAVLLFPEGERGHVKAVGRFKTHDDRQIVVPRAIVEELMSIVFRIKRFFDANFALVSVTTALFLTLVILLSLRLRKREMETLRRIGCASGTVFWLQTWEIALVAGFSLLLAAGVASVAVIVVPKFTQFLQM
jgi:putative ABC transport system permease protein